MKHLGLSILLVFILSSAIQPTRDIENHFRPFQTGWTGGDGIYSIPMDGHKLWLFGDSLIGKVQGKKRINTRMIHNSVALEKNNQWDYYWRKKPLKDIFISPEKGHWFWPGPGIYEHKKLFLLLPQFTTAPGAEGFGFKQSGLYLVTVENPKDSPLKWTTRYQKLDWGVSGDSYSVSAAKDKNHWYVYGYADKNKKRIAKLLRLPLKELKSKGLKPQYWDTRGWSSQATDASALFSGYQSEASIHKDPTSKKWMMVYTKSGLSDKVLLRQASAFEGPWSDPLTLFKYPEMQDKRYFCYAAKHHPHLSKTSDELVIGYACNGFKFQDVLDNTDVYLPRFIKMKVPSFKTHAPKLKPIKF